MQAAKEQGLAAGEALDLGLRRAFWVESRNISLRPVILAVAAEAGVFEVGELANALDDGQARRQLMALLCAPARGLHYWAGAG